MLDAPTPERESGARGRETALPLPDRPLWYCRNDDVELDRAISIDGRPYPKGIKGTVLELEDDQLARFAQQGRKAVMLPGNDLIVVPVPFYFRQVKGRKSRPADRTDATTRAGRRPVTGGVP